MSGLGLAQRKRPGGVRQLAEQLSVLCHWPEHSLEKAGSHKQSRIERIDILVILSREQTFGRCGCSLRTLERATNPGRADRTWTCSSAVVSARANRTIIKTYVEGHDLRPCRRLAGGTCLRWQMRHQASRIWQGCVLISVWWWTGASASTQAGSAGNF